MKRIYFVDIDGTILDCNRGLYNPSDNTKIAFRKIKENGDYIFIASGRAKCLLPKSILDLKPSGFILSNGAYCEYNNEVLFEETMDILTKNKIINFANDNEAAYYLESNDYIYTRDLKMPLHKEYAESWDVIECYKDEGYNDEININIAMLAIHNDDVLVEKVYINLKEYVDINRHGNHHSFDLNIKNVNKGSAIDRLLKILNIDKINSYAFGDGINDIEMMKTVNYSISMGNAHKELIKVTKETTDDVLDDGFYNYLINKHLIG